jgi:hypothetical protein
MTESSDFYLQADPPNMSQLVNLLRVSWWRGVVVIASVTRTEDRGFESRQGV